MNDALSQRSPTDPTLQLVERLWRMRSMASGRILDCGIYRTTHGLELRAAYNPADILYSRPVDNLEHGRRLAWDLRATTLQARGFEELRESR